MKRKRRRREHKRIKKRSRLSLCFWRNEFSLLLFLIFFVAIGAVINIISLGYTGPFYQKPSPIYFTSFDISTFVGDEVCFTVHSANPINATVYLDDALLNKVFIQGGESDALCYDLVNVSTGRHKIEIISQKVKLRFFFTIFNYTVTRAKAPDDLTIEVKNDSLRALFYNGDYKDRFYLMEFDDQSSYFSVKGGEQKTFVLNIPEQDTFLRIGDKEILVKGSAKPTADYHFIPLGLFLFFLPGFVLFRKNYTYAVMFSLSAFVLVSLLLDLTTKLNFYTVFYSWIILTGACFIWRKTRI